MADDDSWVFDSLVGFLRGPVWNAPILTFIENKSVTFDPGSESDESHREIHEEYKNLVDFMLGSYMEDIGITPAQFEEACAKASSNIKSQFQQVSRLQSLFEQVWAADDFEIFERMMTQKNIELQLQALELLQYRYGIIPSIFMPGGEEDRGRSTQDTEQAVLENVLRKSKEEKEAYQKNLDEESQALEKALSTSKQEKEILELTRQQEIDWMTKAIQGQNEDAPVPPQSEEIDSDEFNRRQEYLRDQRDKLLELKRKEREKILAHYERSQQQARPKSSKAARQALSGSKIDSQTLQMRRALAQRLRDEVINQSIN